MKQHFDDTPLLRSRSRARGERACPGEASFEHSVPELIRQRVYGLIAGYEDINDHERLKYDSRARDR